jgi:hypothetical protein
MAIIVERINQMIECDREIIETLKDIKSHVNKQMNIRKRWKAYSSRAVIFGGTVSMGAILFAPFTAGASLVMLDVGAPAIVGGIAGNKTLNVISALNDNGIKRVRKLIEFSPVQKIYLIFSKLKMFLNKNYNSQKI